ncbi:MAG: Fic family protein [Propionibacteriaceae bacterium]|nr:Fic family protein [Propionibacteriaceae bacterium]
MDALARSGGSGKVADTLAQLTAIADRFPPTSVGKVHQLLVAALGTVPERPIASARLAARVAGEPYDGARIELFAHVREELEGLAPSLRPVTGGPAKRRWLPFFEAYFSNYIEGTRFSVEEALAIAVDGVVPANRPEDAHDVSATYRIVADPDLMRQVPTDADSFLDLLVERHRTLMAGRPQMNPGQFKKRQNYAGGTAFVAPDLLVGTLRGGWDEIDRVVDPFHRAVMMMFVVTECHPFDDGNGRLARIMTNAELVARDQARIIVTNSYRSNYLAGLTAVTSNASGRALVSVLDFTRRWVSAVDWSDWDRCMADLTSSNAFLDSAEAEQSGNRLRLPDPA